MDKCFYDRFEGMYNKNNGNVWFFGKCFDNIMEVIKIISDVPTDFDDYIEIHGITCFVKSTTGQIWYNNKTYDNTEKAFRHFEKILNDDLGKTPLKRCKSRTNLDYLAL